MVIVRVKPFIQLETIALLLASASAVFLTACASTKTTAPSISNGVTVSCTPAIMAPGTTSQCSAKSTGAAGAAFTWSASAGSITAAGVFTAPSTTGSVTITAASSMNAAQAGTETLTVQLKTPPSQHIVMIMEENQDYSIVYGNTVGWPNLNKLIEQGALATNYYANVHPSIGNYFMLTTGQTVTTDDNSTTVWDVDNIARRMLANNVTFKVYAEGIHQGYLGGNLGNYVIRHNPFALLTDVAGNPQVASQVIVPFSQFAVDVAGNALPEFSFIVPAVNDDAHSGTQGQADTWLQANVVTPLSGLSAFQSGGDGVLIVDFDEGAGNDDDNGGGRVAPVFWGPLAASGYQQKSSNLYQHQSMLRTIMELLNLSSPPGDAANAPDMAEFFVQK
jgi:acid phosphatase